MSVCFVFMCVRHTPYRSLHSRRSMREYLIKYELHFSLSPFEWLWLARRLPLANQVNEKKQRETRKKNRCASTRKILWEFVAHTDAERALTFTHRTQQLEQRELISCRTLATAGVYQWLGRCSRNWFRVEMRPTVCVCG